MCTPCDAQAEAKHSRARAEAEASGLHTVAEREADLVLEAEQQVRAEGLKYGGEERHVG